MRLCVSRLSFVLALAFAMCSPVRSHAASTWLSIDYPNASATFAQAVNNSGVVVGGYTLRDGTEQGFVYSAGQFSSFTVPASTATVVTAVNDNGVLAGYYSDSTSMLHSFVYDGQNFSFLDYPGARPGTTILAQMNDQGLAVGNYVSNDGVNHGFTYANGQFTSVDVPGASGTFVYATDAAGEVAGSFTVAGGTKMQGFVQTGTTYHTVNFPGATDTAVRGINDQRQFVGLAGGTHGATAGFSYIGKYRPLVYPGAYFTVAYGINNSGAVVGYYIDLATGLGHAFIQEP
ncbi:MAG: hypothetical protein H0X25_22845 [Acidobacteriales bacterium]|nr:hypothetical protein [Terriglobales bacterium]